MLTSPIALPRDTPDICINVAIADYHILLRESVAELLQNRFQQIAGVSCNVSIRASNGRELIDMIGQSKVLPDVCIVDLNMPVLNGLDTIIELNSRFTGIGILVFTAFDMKEYFLRMMEAGANGYLVKTCSIEELVEAIVSIHKSEFYCPDSYTKQLFARVRKQESLTVKLTEMEYQVLKMCCSDLPYKEMAKLLKVSEASIEGYRASLFRKLNLNSRTQLAIYAIKTGLYPLYYDESSNIVK